jgi:hypothetical protein
LRYNRSTPQSYAVRRTQAKPRMKYMPMVQRVPRWAMERIPAKERARVLDNARFLSRFISGTPNLLVKIHGGDEGFVTGMAPGDKFYIEIPDWGQYHLPLSGYDKYRIYRGGVYHEGLHVAHTPKELFIAMRDMLPGDCDLINILEDRRIEDIGQEEWPGSLPERLYEQAYAYALRPPVDLLEKALRAKRGEGVAREATTVEAFLQRMLIGRIKGADGLSPEILERVEKAAKEAEEELEKLRREGLKGDELALRMVALKDRVKQILNVTGDVDTEGGDGGDGGGGGGGRGWAKGPWEKTFTEKYAKERKAGKEKTKKEMDEYLEKGKKKAEEEKQDEEKREPAKEDWEAAKKGSQQTRKEWEQMTGGPEAGESEIDRFFIPVAVEGDTSQYRDRRFMERMAEALKEWKVRRKVTPSEVGAKLSVRQYIRDKEKPFLTTVRRSAAGRKILIITDFSGSIEPRQEDYKRALVSASEVLDGIGANVAVFGFGGDLTSPQYLFKVKGFEERKWRPAHSAKLAGVDADGRTPTHRVYEFLADYIRKHRPDVTVTTTDGKPDEVYETMEKVRELKRHTRMVAMGIEPEPDSSNVSELLRRFGYHKTLSIRSLDELPERLVRLLAPE